MAKRKSETPVWEDLPAPDLDWINRRIAEIYGSQSEASRRLFGHRDSLGRILNKTRGLSTGELVALAALMRMPVGALLVKLGQPNTGGSCPVVGLVNEHGRVRPLPPGKVQMIACPIEVVGGKHGTTDVFDFVALRVQAPQSALAFYHGAHLYYDRASKRVEPGAVTGRHVSVIQIGEDPLPVVGVLHKGSMDTATLSVWGTDEEIETAELISATPIRWIKVG